VSLKITKMLELELVWLLNFLAWHRMLLRDHQTNSRNLILPEGFIKKLIHLIHLIEEVENNENEEICHQLDRFH